MFASLVAVETILFASLSEASYSFSARFLKSLTYFSVSALKLLTSLFTSSINFAFSSLVAANCAAEVSLIPCASFSASTKTDCALDLAALIKVAASSPASAVISASSNSKTFGLFANCLTCCSNSLILLEALELETTIERDSQLRLLFYFEGCSSDHSEAALITSFSTATSSFSELAMSQLLSI